MTTEQEFKWRITSKNGFAAFKRAVNHTDLKKTVARLFIFDSYFDNAERALGASKTALRLRSTDGDYEITVKGATAIKNGLAARKEETFPIREKSQTRAMSFFRSFVHKRWPELGPVKQLFIIKNHRESILLESENLTAELSLDDCNILVSDKNIKLYEAELEFKEGSLERFKDLAQFFTEQTRCEYATISKVATALKNL